MSNALRIGSAVPLVLFLAACETQIPARLETVNGRQVEVATAGTGGDVTVVFESGLGNDWTPWDGVAAEVAQHAPIFAYSRPGYGASDLTTSPRDPRTIVEELRVLLDSQGYAPPYLLVGHSNGGGYMELFAKSHPDEVAGAVLVDPRHRDFLAACQAAGLSAIDCGVPDSMLAHQGPAVRAEYPAYSMASDQMRVAGTFGDYPVRVLTAMDGSRTAARQELWQSMHASLAAEATDGAQILVEGSTHNVMVDRPDIVVDTIVDLLH